MEIKQEYKVVPVGSIKPHPDNPNHGDVDLIRESIQANSWYGAVIVQRSRMRIIAGEHRWRAAKKEGAKDIPVILRDCDDVEALRILLVDNESARQAEVDPALVQKVLHKLAKLGDDALTGSGFTLSDLEEIEKKREQEEDDDSLIEPGEGDDLETVYGIIVMVRGEQEQQEAFEKLTAEYGAENLRVVSV
jgi:ParB-like chromosome segregation protein Spo0J